MYVISFHCRFIVSVVQGCKSYVTVDSVTLGRIRIMFQIVCEDRIVVIQVKGQFLLHILSLALFQADIVDVRDTRARAPITTFG